MPVGSTMSPRPRVPKNFELLELAFRTSSLALELSSLGVLSYLSVEFVYDHATNPVVYAGVRAPGLPSLTRRTYLIPFTNSSPLPF